VLFIVLLTFWSAGVVDHHHEIWEPKAYMEVQFTVDEEAQLSGMASSNGTDAGQLVKVAALKAFQDDSRFREGVQRGIDAAERGDFVESSAVWANVEKILKS